MTLLPLTLAQIFGNNASQDINQLTIHKADLPSLTPMLTNTTESLLVAICLKALQNFQGLIEDENNQAITDENNRPIEFDNSDAYELLSLFNWDIYFIEKSSSIFIRNTIVIQNYQLNED